MHDYACAYTRCHRNVYADAYVNEIVCICLYVLYVHITNCVCAMHVNATMHARIRDCKWGWHWLTMCVHLVVALRRLDLPMSW